MAILLWPVNSNTSHVIIQSDLSRWACTCGIFKYISCYYSIVGWWYFCTHFSEIQIHLMLLFNGDVGICNHKRVKIQIHLMLLFNTGEYQDGTEQATFKYISCYYSIPGSLRCLCLISIQIHLMLLFNQCGADQCRPGTDIQIHLMLLFNQRFSVAFPA